MNEIKCILDSLGIKKQNCIPIIGLKTLSEINWVSPTQVCFSEKLTSTLYRNCRVPLYSKSITLEMLEEIKEELLKKQIELTGPTLSNNKK